MLRNIAISDSVSMRFLMMLLEHALYIYELCLLVTIIQTKLKKMMRFKIKHNYCTNCAPLITLQLFPFPSFPHPAVHAIITEFPIFLDCQTCIKQPVQFFRKKYLFCILEIIVTVIFYIARSPKSATMPTLEFSN